MNRKLDVGGTLSQIFSTYRKQAGVLLPVAFVIYLVVAVVDAILYGNFVLSVTFGLAVAVVAATLYQGMVVNLVKDVQDGHRDYSALAASTIYFRLLSLRGEPATGSDPTNDAPSPVSPA